MSEPAEIRQMLKSRRLERVAANPHHSEAVIAMAEQHVVTARALATTDDQAMAFTAAYDAARKAQAAVLALHGLRVRPAGGAHHNTGVAVAALIDDPVMAEFEWMRQVRNATEYPSDDRPSATQQDVAEGIDASEDIVRACAAHVRRNIP